MMKKIITVMLVVAMVLSLCSCAGNFEVGLAKSIATVLVIGDRNNSSAANLNSKMLKDELLNTVQSGGVILVIQIDGNPELVFGNSYESLLEYAGANPEKFKKDVKTLTSKAEKAIATAAKADDPEADVLKALDIAVRALADYPDMDKRMIIIDSGLSTTGVLDFNNNLIYADPESLAEELLTRHEIPDFTGVQDISWFQMGETETPQAELNGLQKDQLGAIWKAVFAKGGGILNVKENYSVNSARNVEGYPFVSKVDIVPAAPISYTPIMDNVTPISGDSEDGDVMGETNVMPRDTFKQPQVLTEEVLGFHPDSDEFLLGDDEVDGILQPIADYLMAYPDTEILLAGATAGDNNVTAYSVQLSQSRAEAVKNRLVSLGCDSEKLTAIGLSCKDPWHIYGVGTSGPLASSNRKVILIDKASDVADEVLSIYKEICKP